jgi:class I fructose-bisphosphate aldolase
MRLTDRVKQILSWYPSDSPGTKMNLARLLNTGTLAGTGKLVILPVDQGFEHGPARSFAPNPAGYDPDYHVQLAIEAGCTRTRRPRLSGAVAGNHRWRSAHPQAQQLDSMSKIEPASAVTGSVKDAVRLGCAAVGYTIYPGSGQRNVLLQELREIIEEAKEHALPTVVWAYVRGAAIPKESEQAVDLIAYAAQEAAQLGAHVVKVKPPKDQVELAEAKKVYEKYAIPTKTLADRVRHVVQSCFNGKRVIIFSGGEAKDTPAVLEEIRGIRDGGGFGSIMGRNAFQRPKEEALKLLRDVMGIYQGK